MYCMPCINNINCVLRELLLWSDISSEHPIFIKTTAQLTNKNLPKKLIDELMEINRIFTEINNRAKILSGKISGFQRVPSDFIIELKRLIDEFLKHDIHVVKVLDELKQYGKEDKVWQTLLEHITEEQKFMYSTFTSLKKQLP